ncbi:MAG TPA: aminoacyl-tRNA hydrolase [Saprospiraceae bacterium]|nr:aminoacyl-tRNA hydrolase [Saprospiraceae bacterium]HRO09693.1 aminoacyl-tRNA hydrolase [Saprospiraceae bacterium]HRO73691.1 aminoacyl-tRNA hydrolase [Saprospiraceae bacterium]HRP43105.1 aminoacyl-tRNA hydrolase [Saprospiraceae bacterium]
MKYLITGLGNMGAEYDHTRHNIGFDVVDYLANDAAVKWEQNTNGDLAEIKFKGRTLILLKPTTYMNLSGKAVKYWMEKLKIQPENLLVIVDDLHLDLGKMRLRDKGSDGGHNGLKDIQNKLGHNQYIRLRMGIGKDFRPGQQVNFVLGKWKQHEKESVEIMIEKAAKAVKNFVTIGMKLTMDELNRG